MSMSIMSVILPENVYFDADPSSETQGGAVSGGREKSKGSYSRFDFLSPECFSRPFRSFPFPTNFPWVSEDDADLSNIL